MTANNPILVNAAESLNRLQYQLDELNGKVSGLASLYSEYIVQTPCFAGEPSAHGKPNHERISSPDRRKSQAIRQRAQVDSSKHRSARFG